MRYNYFAKKNKNNNNTPGVIKNLIWEIVGHV